VIESLAREAFVTPIATKPPKSQLHRLKHDEEIKGVDFLPGRMGAMLVLILGPFVLAFPPSSAAFLKYLVPFLPLMAYVTIGVFIHDYLHSVMDPEAQISLNNFIPVSLTLSTFSFAAISLMVSFFKDEIKDNSDPFVTETVFCFCAALLFFIVSFMVLRFRGEYLILYAWEGATDSGLWCMLVGLMIFATDKLALHPARIVVVIGMLAYAPYLYAHFRKYFGAARNFRASLGGS